MRLFCGTASFFAGGGREISVMGIIGAIFIILITPITLKIACPLFAGQAIYLI